MEQNTMFQSLSDTQVEEGIGKYASSPSIVEMLKREQQRRVEVQAEAMIALEGQAQLEESKLKLEAGISKLANKYLPKPDELEHTPCIVFVAEEVDDTSQEAVEITLEGGGTEARFPKVRVWVYKPGAIWAQSATTKVQGKVTAKARAGTAYKRDGNMLESKGNFPSGAIACKHLGIVVGADSAVRALQREGYIWEAYEGTEFTTS